MKKALKIGLIVFLGLIILTMGVFISLTLSIKNVNLDTSKLINVNNSIIYYDRFNNPIEETSYSNQTVSIKELPNHVKNAFISIEDKRFYSHNGVDYKALARALFKNVKSGFLKEGASTITQQLIKNTHLTSEKTFKRKLAEIKLARQLEKKLNKDEILEKYLNTIYFGENCYGIAKASHYYFNKSPKELTLNESASLAGCIKAPSYYSPTADIEKNFTRKNVVLEQMYLQGYITKQQFDDNSTKKIDLNIQEKNGYTVLDIIKTELNSFVNDNVYRKGKINVYTTIDVNVQHNLEKLINDCTEKVEKTAIILDKSNKILAFYSTIKDDNRQLGSTLKPLLVYAPAIETGTVDSCTFLKDEKTDFNGYSPSNYNDVYYGDITVKQSLAKSLNVCSAKLMNLTGVENCIKYLEKTDIPLTEKDYNLSSSLGATEKGANLLQITSSYGVFSNSGNYYSPTCITKITQEEFSKTFTQKKEKIFSDDTIFIINDMLRYTVTDGTAKKLSFNNYPIHAKTGTVGNKNGNTDAYCISYTNDYTVGVRLSNKKDSLMSNNVSGGSFPSIISNEIWKNLYETNTPTKFEECTTVKKVYIDRISFEDDKIIEIADDIAPKRYVLEEYFTNNSTLKNKSTRFSSPKIETPKLSVNSNGISIRLCLIEYYDFMIYRIENGFKTLVYDSISQGKQTEIFDNDIKPNTEYVYSVIPYFKNENQNFYGEEIILNKIKSPTNNVVGDDWWSNEFD